SVVGGGGAIDIDEGNIAEGSYSVVSGGRRNHAHDNGSTVAGGEGNNAYGQWTTVSGGQNNEAGADEPSWSTVGGGQDNYALGAYATVPGGYSNSAFGDFSCAMGQNAVVDGEHHATFVWSDNPGGFMSTDQKQFLISAANGVGIMTNAPTKALDVDGNVRIRQMPFGSGNSVKIDGTGVLYEQSSSRRHKDNIRDLSINADPVLQLNPVTFQWKSTGEEDFGLIAEDVAELLPELVVYDNEGRPNGVKYDLVPVYLLGVLQQQQATIDYLNEQVASNAALKEQVSQLGALVEILLAERNDSSGGSDEPAAGK
ncbi:tail fiber domain-containing protein, partial [Candidatus Zixiibacteriota bacterium]